MVVCFGEPALADGARLVRVSGHAGRLLAGLVARRQGANIDQLIDTVWPEDPPKSARSALHVHLGRLRRVLDDTIDGPTIARAGSMYRLELGEWTVDVDEFQELRRRAADNPDAAIDLLRDALALADGPAFVVDGESVAPSATYQLASARLDLEEEYVNALLTARRFTEAERVAVDLVDAEPYRERRWGLLMLIQASQGRRREALATYERARRRLADDLGLDPGDDLRQTQRLVLSGDTGALHQSESVVELQFDRPPRALGELIGRDASVDRVERAVTRRLPVVITGAPGTGKTRLAIEVAQHAVARGGEVAWLDLRNIVFADTSFATEIARWVRRHPQGLVVIDNAETSTDVARGIVDAVRHASVDIGLLVTSRVPLPIDGVVELLDPLELPNSAEGDEIEASTSVILLRDLLATRAPRADVPSRLAADLVARVSGLPLGIRLVADLARSVPPDQMLARTLATLRPEIEPAVSAVLAALEPDTRAVFATSSVVPGQLDADLIGALAGCDRTGAAVAELCDHGLMLFDVRRPDAPYSILEPLRDVADGLLTDAARAAVFDRLVAECVRRAEAYALPRPDRPDEEPIRVRLARELPWHRQAIDHLARRGESEPALQIASALELALYSLGWWAINTALQDSALAIPGPPSSVRARVHAARGRPGLLHELDAFHLDRALHIAAEVGDRPVEAKVLYQLGILHWSNRAYELAYHALEEAARVAGECGDWFISVEARRFLGIAMITGGRTDEGFAIQLGVLDEVRTRRHAEVLLPHVYMYLGHCRRHVGDDDAAAVNLEFARESYERSTNTASLIHVYGGLAEMAVDRGDVASALAYAGRGLEVSSAGGVGVYDPWLLCTVARAHTRAGDDASARHSVAAAVSELGRGWEGETHRVAGELAVVAWDLGDARSAARLIGLADVTPDRRDLPFVSPAERARVGAVRAAVAGSDTPTGPGARSTIAEAASRLLAPVLAS